MLVSKRKFALSDSVELEGGESRREGRKIISSARRESPSLVNGRKFAHSHSVERWGGEVCSLFALTLLSLRSYSALTLLPCCSLSVKHWGGEKAEIRRPGERLWIQYGDSRLYQWTGENLLSFGRAVRRGGGRDKKAGRKIISSAWSIAAFISSASAFVNKWGNSETKTARAKEGKI